MALRNLVGHHIGFELSADPVWDMLLDLYVSEHRERDIAISSLASIANVPPTTALRSIRAMRELGLVSRHGDPGDGRRVYIKLTPKSHGALAAIFDAVAERGARR
jgi:DNA-binding MarR family transcriptional regulator